MRNRTSDLRIPRSDALPLSHRNSNLSKVYHEVHMIRVLRTPRIKNVDSVMSVESIREIGNFELGKDIVKDPFFSSQARDKTKKNSLYLYRAQNLPSPSFYLRIS